MWLHYATRIPGGLYASVRRQALITGVVAGMWAESCPRQERHHESHASREEAMQYLVQMKLADSVRPRSPEEAIGLALVVRAESIQELDDVLESLPIWPLMQTTVIPLTSFEGRRAAGRRRLEDEVRRAGGQRS